MKKQRTRILTNKKIQYALARRIMMHWAVLFVTSFTLLTVWQLLVSGEPFNLFSEHMKNMWVRIVPVFVVLLVLLPVFVYDTFKFSNSITGPIFRLQKSVRSLAKGEKVEPISFRKNDFWKELAKEFNNLLEATNHDLKTESKNESEEVTADSV